MGQKILAGRYEIHEKIGEGGMAVVYRARDKLLSRMVAIKILRPEFVKDTTFVESFRRESRAAASLSHPNIVNIYDVGKEGNIYFIVMELVEGQTLSEVIANAGPLDYKTSISVAKQVASALSLAHRNNIIHRDVKPHNILITADGRAKITDFGIAKAVTDGTIISDSNTVMGSAHYFSPEQGRGQYVDEKSDIYSLGIVLYEMLTGRVPFDADNPVTIALMHMNDPLIPPSRLAPGIPPGLEQIVLKATEKYQVNRFRSIDEMFTALDNVNFVTGIIEDPVVRGYVSRPEPAAASAYADEGYGQEEQFEDDYDEEDYEEDYDDYDEDDEDEIVTPRGNGRGAGGKSGGNNKKKKKNKTRNSAIILAIVAALVLSVLGYFGYQWFISNGGETVPDLQGKTPAEAEQLLAENKAGFKLEVLEQPEYSDTVSAGAISSQTPEAGRKLKKGETIKVVLSQGPQEVTQEEPEPTPVPDVVGKKEEDAVYTLETAGYKVDVERQDNEKPSGQVFRQDPQSGAEAEAGSSVIIYVSTGPKIVEVTVPDLSGKTKAQAKTALEGKKLNLGDVTEEYSDVKAGTVISQSPKAGATLNEKEKVSIVLSKGPEEKEGSLPLTINFETAPADTFDLTVQVVDSKGKSTYTLRNEPVLKSEGSRIVTVTGKGKCTVNVYFNSTRYDTYTADFTTGKII